MFTSKPWWRHQLSRPPEDAFKPLNVSWLCRRRACSSGTNPTLGTRFGGRHATQSGRSGRAMASGGIAPKLTFARTRGSIEGVIRSSRPASLKVIHPPTSCLTGIGHSRANCQWFTGVRVGQAATIPIAVRVGHMRRSKPGNWCGEPRRKDCNLLTAS